MPHLEHKNVDVTQNLTVSYVASPGSEWAKWDPKDWTADGVVDAIDRQLWDLDMRRRELESAKAAVVAQAVRSLPVVADTAEPVRPIRKETP